ncbi:MAG: hypothetical protein WCS31_16495 [Verrucomicrobiae bacterium]
MFFFTAHCRRPGKSDRLRKGHAKVKQRAKKTLSERLAAGRKEVAASPDPETDLPSSSARRIQKTFPSASRRPEKWRAGAPVTPANEAEEKSAGFSARFQRLCGDILHEIAPGLLHFLRDSRKRRRSVRAYQNSRPTMEQIARPETWEDAGPATGRAARALPKLDFLWARRLRAAAWRVFRPALRWQRRSSATVVLGTYFGILGILSLSAMAFFLMPSRHAPRANTAPLPAAALAPKAIQKPAPSADDLARLQEQAENELRAGDYAAAEQHFRELLPNTRFRALAGFQIFLCLLKQKKTAEAEGMLRLFPTNIIARNPSGMYARAATALMQGRTEDAQAEILSARRLHPFISPLYDKALSDAAIAPEP